MAEAVQCPVCKRPARVNLDGQLRKHKAILQTSKRFGVWCNNRNPDGTVMPDGAASGGRLTTPDEQGTVPSSGGSKLPSRPTPVRRRMRKFREFQDRVLSNPAARVAFEDAQARNTLIDTLIALRRQRGLRQTDVALRMGVHQSTISLFEGESSDPQLSTIQRYARAVGADLIMELQPHDEVAAQAQG